MLKNGKHRSDLIYVGGLTDLVSAQIDKPLKYLATK